MSLGDVGVTSRLSIWVRVSRGVVLRRSSSSEETERPWISAAYEDGVSERESRSLSAFGSGAMIDFSECSSEECSCSASRRPKPKP